jgi:hypothetical protein
MPTGATPGPKVFGLCALLSVDLIDVEHAAVAALLASKALKYIANKICNILGNS